MSPLGGLPPSWYSSIMSPTGTPRDEFVELLNEYDQFVSDDGTVMTTAQIDALRPEDRIDVPVEDVETRPSTALPETGDSSQPLSMEGAMRSALTEIDNGEPESRTRRDERRPANVPDPATRLAGLVQARQQVAAAKKAEAEKAAAIGQAPGPRPEKRGHDPTSPTTSGKKAKANPAAADPNAMETAEFKAVKNRPTSFDHLRKFTKQRCAVMIEDTGIMGNPFSPTFGWEVKFSIDPGEIGQPSIGLDFAFSKTGADSKSNDDYNTFAVGWEPGVKIGVDWMMEDFAAEVALNPSDPNFRPFTYPAAIKALCGDRKKDADRLCCISFRSNAHKSSEMSLDWPKALRGDASKVPLANLERMFAGNASYQVTIWFVNPHTTHDWLFKSCLTPFSEAVVDHTPPFHQYLDQNDEPMIDFNLPNIHDIGNGMYRRYPKVTDDKGKKVVSTTPAYVNLPKTVTWDSIKTFHVTHGVPIVRNMQYDKGVNAKLESGWHRLFIQKLPELSVDGKSLVPDPKMKHTYRVGVRLTRDPKSQLKPVPPPLGSTILFDPFNGNKQREHESVKENICFGRVSDYGGKAWLDRTKTDFCVLMTVPRNMTMSLVFYGKALSKADNDLTPAKLSVKVNYEPALREKRAFKKFCDETYAPELLDRIRLAFWSDPSKVDDNTDLTLGPAHDRSEANATKYKQIINAMKAGRKSNKSQDDVLMSAAHMKSNIVAVQGPPGAGKTRTLRDKVIALTKIGHKVLVVAPSNVAVDTDAEAIWKALTPEDRKTIKVLRLETDGAEKAQRLTKVGFAQYAGKEGEEDQLPEYLGPKEAQDHPAIRNALDKLCMDFVLREDYATRMFEKYEDLDEAYKAINEYDGLKQSNAPLGVTLDRRIWELTQADRMQAEVDYKAARDAMTHEEFTTRLTGGDFTVAHFDKSDEYRRCIKNYIQNKGKISKKERTALEDASDAMVLRVLAETHILLTTASNCGGPLLTGTHTFVPTVIFCDEAGQISIPGLCVPLITFQRWEGLFLFGDIQQLAPTLLSGQFNEFAANAKTSPLALLEIKKFGSYLLDTQYRMCPACSKFPRDQFYDGKGLKDSELVKVDNEVRQYMRNLSKASGAIGDKNEGTEYLVYDVPNGCSRVELNGTSLVNHANADVIVGMIGQFLEEGAIKASMIKILAYYQGQRRLIRRKIVEQGWKQDDKDAIEILTVDACQSRESRVIIVDMVAAKDKIRAVTMKDDSPDDEEDTGTEEYVKAGVVTGHVRNPARLNVALTRGQDTCIVVCQAGLLASTARVNRGKQYNAVANMVGDAQGRRCILTDLMQDSHPDAVEHREKIGEKKADAERTTQEARSLEFIAEGKERWRSLRYQAALPAADPLPRYRTRRGDTTRPIGNPVVIAEADAHDEEQKQLADAEAASLATAAIEEEDRRTLELAVGMSLDPSAESKDDDDNVSNRSGDKMLEGNEEEEA